MSIARHVKEDGVGSHRETAALGRSAAHGFHTEARLDERVAEARQRGLLRPERNWRRRSLGFVGVRPS